MHYLKALSHAVVELRRSDEQFARMLQEDIQGCAARIAAFDAQILEVDEAISAAEREEYKAVATVQSLESKLLQLEAQANPLAKYLVTYRDYGDAIGKMGAAEVVELDAELELHNAVAEQHDLRDRLADLRAEFAAADTSERAATQLAVNEGVAAFERATAQLESLQDRVLELTSSSIQASDRVASLADSLTRHRRNLDPSDEMTAQFLEAVHVFEEAIVMKARASKAVREARIEMEKSTRSSARFVRPNEQQREEWLRARRAYRAASVAASELQRNVRATQKQVEDAERRRREEREKERSARVGMLEARRFLEEEQAEERSLIRTLTGAQRNLTDAVEEVRIASESLSHKANAMFEDVGPAEKERLAALQDARSELDAAVTIRDHCRRQKARHANSLLNLRAEREESERRKNSAVSFQDALQSDTALPVLEAAASTATSRAATAEEFRELRSKIGTHRASIAKMRSFAVTDSRHASYDEYRRTLLRDAAEVLSDFEKACQTAEIAIQVQSTR